MSPQPSPSTTFNQHHPNTHTSSRSSTNPTILIASIVALLSTVAIAVLSGNEDTAGLFGFRRFFGGGVTSSRSSTLQQASSAVQGFSSSAVTPDELKMRTPVYFLSHGGVRLLSFFLFLSFFDIDTAGLINHDSQTLCTKSTTRPTKSSAK